MYQNDFNEVGDSSVATTVSQEDRKFSEIMTKNILKDLTSKLFGVLTRFRLHEVAIIADVEAMFYQV